MEMRSGARRQFGFSDVFFAGMLLSMHKPRASTRKVKSAEGLPKNTWSDSVLFGRPPLPFFWSIGLSIEGTVTGRGKLISAFNGFAIG